MWNAWHLHDPHGQLKSVRQPDFVQNHGDSAEVPQAQSGTGCFRDSLAYYASIEFESARIGGFCCRKKIAAKIQCLS